MLKRKTMVVMLFAFALAVAAAACRKLETGRFRTPAAPAPPKILAAIPLEYGDLIAAAPVPDNPYWSALWFQRPDKTICLVYVNLSQEKVVVRATIPRK